MPTGGEAGLLEAGAVEPPSSGGNGTWRYIGKKVLGALASLAFVLVFNFFLFRVLPGDPAKMLTRNHLVSPAAVARLNHQFGLDQPLMVQFWDYLRNTLTGNLGISFKYEQPVTQVIWARLPPTLWLVGTSTILSTIIGMWVGIKSGWQRGSRFDVTSNAISLTLYAMPEFWLGMLLALLFAVGIGPLPGVFPAGGLSSPLISGGGMHAWLDQAWHLTLPVITLTLAYLAEYSLIMRSSLVDELGADYLTTARAKGLRSDQVRRRHAVPNALLPFTTLSVLNLGFVVSGAITIETVFSIPGLGLLSYEAIAVPDFPLLEGIFLLFSAGVIIANLVADLLYGVLDPRVRLA